MTWPFPIGNQSRRRLEFVCSHAPTIGRSAARACGQTIGEERRPQTAGKRGSSREDPRSTAGFPLNLFGCLDGFSTSDVSEQQLIYAVLLSALSGTLPQQDLADYLYAGRLRR